MVTGVTTIDLDVRNPSGLHARPAAVFVRTANTFQADIKIENLSAGTSPVNAKSIISVLSLGIRADHRVRITSEGVDAATAVAELATLVTGGLGESLDP